MDKQAEERVKSETGEEERERERAGAKRRNSGKGN